MLVRNQRPPRSGAHLVEFAVVIPVFLTFILGFIEVGRAFMVASLLHNAARAGCRAGIISGTSNADVSSAVTSQTSPQRIPTPTIAIKVNNATADVSTATLGDVITVQATVPIATITWLPSAFFLKGTLQGQYTLTRE